MMLRPQYALSVAILLLAGCASVPPPAPPATLPVLQRQQVLSSVTHWVASGAASLSSSRGHQAFSFRWQQAPTEQHLSIYGPLGQTVARLQNLPQGATLETLNGTVRRAKDVSSLLQEVIGVDLPVRALPDWMLGIPPARAVTQTDAKGLPQSLHWQDWQVHYLRYTAVGSLELPALLEADGPNGLHLRLAITRWQLGQ